MTKIFFHFISLQKKLAQNTSRNDAMTEDATTKRRVPKGQCDQFFFEKEILSCSCCTSEDTHSVVLFYRYVSIEKEQLLELKENVEDMMNALDIRGKIRLSVEGINATASGRESSMKEFERRMKSTDGQFVNLDLSQVDFKSEHVKESHLLSGGGCKHIFENASVRIVDEVCPFEPSSKKSENASIESHLQQQEQQQQPNRLTPREWRDAIESSDDDVVVLDVRNSYESRMGRFVPEKTVCCPLRRFSQFKEWVEEKGGMEYIENKKVLAYCTGGVRCEKATSYLLSLNATKEVSVLEGGIVAYARDVGDEGFVGKNYVFDARGCVDVGDNDKALLTKCDGCNTPCLPHLARCASKACHAILAACNECSSMTIYCCNTCKANKDGEKKLACECDSYRSREMRCEVPAAQ